MAYIEGDADHGSLHIDGPTSLFSPSTRYGLAIAKPFQLYYMLPVGV